MCFMICRHTAAVPYTYMLVQGYAFACAEAPTVFWYAPHDILVM